MRDIDILVLKGGIPRPKKGSTHYNEQLRLSQKSRAIKGLVVSALGPTIKVWSSVVLIRGGIAVFLATCGFTQRLSKHHGGRGYWAAISCHWLA